MTFLFDWHSGAIQLVACHVTFLSELAQGAVAQYGGVTPTKDYSPFGRLPSAAQPAAMSPQSTAFSHPGNMYGLMVRACSPHGTPKEGTETGEHHRDLDCGITSV